MTEAPESTPECAAINAASMAPESTYRKAPHDYQHVGSGRWMCATCREFIVNRDCRVNQEWLAATGRESS
jgi:hypothetical protein